MIDLAVFDIGALYFNLWLIKHSFENNNVYKREKSGEEKRRFCSAKH